jgi:hypothetical protein
MQPSFKPLEFSFPLPKAPHMLARGHLTFLGTATTLFLTTTALDGSPSTLSALGSFVYAMPDVSYASTLDSLLPTNGLERSNLSNVISTAIYSSSSTVDFANRVAKILARKTMLPVYVGCSMDLSSLTAEEEIEGLTKVIETVMGNWNERG